MASRSACDLCPEMRSKLVEFLTRARLAKIDVLIYCTYRSKEEQNALYSQGRTAPGPKVTWTKKSKHNVTDANGRPSAEAWDCVPMVNGKCAWNAKEIYLQLAAIASAIGGLRWGGDFNGDGVPFERGEYDSPHFELVRK